LDIHQGLPENLEIDWRGRRYLQRLDYLGIPFRCSYCRSTSHLRRDCKGIVDSEDEPEGTFPEYDTPDTSQETGFYGPGPIQLAQGDDISPGTLESLVGKLQTFCPILFSSLSLLERDVINSSEWLKNMTKNVETSRVVDGGVSVISNQPTAGQELLNPSPVASPMTAPPFILSSLDESIDGNLAE
jgi:hypothetical protein